MQEGKLIKLLKSLTKEEFRRLEDYINSPFFLKKSKDALSLYRAIKRQYPNFQSVVLAKKRVFKKVYPDQVYSDGKMRNLLSKLVKITESYLLYLDNEADKFEKNKQLVRIYGKRNIYDEFVKKIHSLTKSLAELPYRDANFYYNRYLLDSELYFHVHTQKDKEAVNLLKSSLLNFEYYFVLERGKLGIDLKNREKIYFERNDFHFNNFSQIIPRDHPIYQLYNISLKLIRTGEATVFFDLKQLYLEEIDNLGKNDKAIFFKILQNFATQQLHKHEEKYQPILMHFFKLGIDKEILLQNGKIKGLTFLNIIAIGLKRKEIDWVKLIIIKYKDKILEETNGFTYSLSTALVAFNEKKYTKVIDVLNTSTFPNTLNHYGFKSLIIRATFKTFPTDTNYYQMFIKQCLSFEKYLTRDGITVTKKIETHLNFTKFIKKIGQLIFNKKLTEAKKETLLLELEKNNKISYKNWLINCLKEEN